MFETRENQGRTHSAPTENDQLACARHNRGSAQVLRKSARYPQDNSKKYASAPSDHHGWAMIASHQAVSQNPPHYGATNSKIRLSTITDAQLKFKPALQRRALIRVFPTGVSAAPGTTPRAAVQARTPIARNTSSAKAEPREFFPLPWISHPTQPTRQRRRSNTPIPPHT